MAVLGQARREQILTLVLQKGHATVRDLALGVEASEATVRRDLRALADDGRLDLVYGGATLPRVTDFSFRSKAQRNAEPKRAVGALAASLVNDGESIFLDGGTTVFEMAAHLKGKRGLSVIVNSARLAAELGSNGDAAIVSLGGLYRPDRMDFIGPIAMANLEQIRGYRAFIGADGLSTEFGVAACDIESAHLYRLAIRNARETILVVDHTKFQAPSLFKICEVAEISRIVTDCAPPPPWTDFLNEKGIEVLHTQQPSQPAMNGD